MRRELVGDDPSELRDAAVHEALALIITLLEQ
jgi:hypothetical protein